MRVTKAHGKRIVHLHDGKEVHVTKKTLTEFVHGTVNQQYRTRAFQSMRIQNNGKVGVTIGGAVKGERRLYPNKAAALRGIAQHYGPAKRAEKL